MLSKEQVEARAAAMQEAFVEAARRNEWAWIADAFYAQDCEYLCEYAGTLRVHAKNRDEIRATHYGRDMMVGWEGWSFPIERYTTHGNRIITHWWNRGPGTRADGSYFQTPGVSFITVGDDGVTLNDGVKVVTADVLFDHGVIHVIDTVLTPPAAS